jgi:hypothetical protein
MNVDFGLKGAVSKRKGYTRFDSPNKAILYRKIHTWNQFGGNHFIVVVGPAEVAHSSGATFTSQATGWAAPTDADDWYTGVVAYNNVLYVSSKNGNAWSFNGSAWTEITDSNLDGTGTEFPKAAHLEGNYDRVWAANLFNNAVEYSSRVHFSVPGNAVSWGVAAGGGFIDVDPDDGFIITGLKVFGSNLMVFKEQAVYTISGDAKESFTVTPLDRNIGTTAPDTIQTEGDRLIFFDPLSGVWQFDGAGFSRMDDKINLHLLDGINQSQAYKSSAFLWRGRYFLSVPWGADTYPSRTFVLDLRTSAWSQYDYGVMSWANKTNTVHAVGMKNGQGVYKMFDGLTDNGSAVASFFETAWIAPEQEAKKHRLRRVDFAFSALGNVNVGVEFKVDFQQTAVVSKTINTSPGGMLWGTSNWGSLWGAGVDEVFKRETGWPYRWNVAKFKISENTSLGVFQLNRITMHSSFIDRVRGEV